MNSNPRISSSVNLQNIESIRSHLNDLYGDYDRTKNSIVLDFINEWQIKLNIKQKEQDERCD